MILNVSIPKAKGSLAMLKIKFVYGNICKTYRASVSILITYKGIAKLTYIVLVLQIGYYVNSDNKIFHVKFFVPDKNKVSIKKYYTCSQNK